MSPTSAATETAMQTVRVHGLHEPQARAPAPPHRLGPASLPESGALAGRVFPLHERGRHQARAIPAATIMGGPASQAVR